MRIFEEYLKRHNIDVPIVRHCSIGTLILRGDNRWAIMSIKWEHHDYHPGQYQIHINSPIHDGYMNEILFTKNSPIYKKWDEYENFFLKWDENYPRLKPIADPKEVVLAAWEMFVFSCDSWFSKKDFKIKQLLFESLDKDNSLDLRYDKYQEMINYISDEYPLMFRIWKNEVLARTQNYSFWLAAALNKIVS